LPDLIADGYAMPLYDFVLPAGFLFFWEGGGSGVSKGGFGDGDLSVGVVVVFVGLAI
jgi:hypothetical protein